MRPLDDAQRSRLLTWSALFCAIPLCLAPLAGRSSFELAAERAAFSVRLSAPDLQNVWNDKPVNVARDPFVSEGTPRTPIVGMRVTQGQPMGFVVPASPGSAGTPPRGAGLPAVNAVVTGRSPRALLDDGSHVRIVSIGDRVAGSRIVQITADGVLLENGMVLVLSENQP